MGFSAGVDGPWLVDGLERVEKPYWKEFLENHESVVEARALEEKYDKGEFEMVQYAAGMTVGGVENKLGINNALPALYASRLIQKM